MPSSTSNSAASEKAPVVKLYNLVLPLLIGGARLTSLFSTKMRRGVQGRSTLIPAVLEGTKPASNRLRILIHAASFGELEQAKPVIAELRREIPDAFIHLTFFSPSGYENAFGKYAEPDLITYSPLDTKPEVKSFLDAAKPDLALFTKYDVWPNLAFELSCRGIPAVLFSATADDQSNRLLPVVRQLNALVYRSLRKIFVIGPEDKAQFEALVVLEDHIEIAGDTRYDQVMARKSLLKDAALPKPLLKRIAEKGSLVFVVGSSWDADERIIQKALRESILRNDNIVTILVPHEPSKAHVDRLRKHYGISSILFSEISKYNREPVIIVDSIGKLFGLYQSADFAMIGGGFGAGLHNALEAAVFGIPVIVGPRHHKTKEVQQMIDSLAAFEVSSPAEFEFAFWRLVQDNDLRERSGQQGGAFVQARQGATKRIVAGIIPLLRKQTSTPS